MKLVEDNAPDLDDAENSGLAENVQISDDNDDNI
jgi:hypothetical protein